MKWIASLIVFGITTCIYATDHIRVTRTDDSTSYVMLFDFSERWYGPGANETRIRWEDEFIAIGKKAEKTPERYIRHMMNWLYLDGTERSLSEFRVNYIFGSGQYSLDYYRTAEDDNSDYVRETLRESYLFNHISRSNENIERLWGVFGGLVKEIAGVYLEKGRPERLYIQGLIDAWGCITATKGYQKKLDACYKKLVNEMPDTYSMHDYVKYFTCAGTQSFAQNDQANYVTNEQWLYTFWVRRYHEGNTAATLAVLHSLLQ